MQQGEGAGGDLLLVHQAHQRVRRQPRRRRGRRDRK
jgi:hypothetical protein